MEELLNSINQPQDIKRFSTSQMEKLAGEIRGLLIHTVSQTGGHLAPNLGVVELTLALHRVFDSPRDKLVWDVGHQTYVHKILTGRYREFGTLRQLNGLSGFPKRAESEHDVFDTGHSSTSISAALGLALARDLAGEKHNVIAIIGDGSLTGGQAYEALNHAGHLGAKLMVVLNDNEMSIAKNVGAMSEYLAKVRSDPTYSKVKHDVEYLLKRIPSIGESVVKTVERVKDSLKYLIVPGVIFEELGFTYFGPIDGHNINSLTEVLQKAKTVKGPVLVHVITCKGKGYGPAECCADQFHGVGPFCVESGEVLKNGDNPSYTAVFGETLAAIGAVNKAVVAITAAMPAGTGLKQFAAEYPQRFFDVGIAEQHAVTLAAGMAVQGLRPVVAIYSTFLQRAYDQVLHDVCLQNLPVVFAIDRAGIIGEDGATHQGIFDCAYLSHIPNLIIMAPKDENELRHMLYTAVQVDAPTAIRYPREAGLGVVTGEPLRTLEIGRAEKLRPGKDVVLFAVGAMVAPCLDAAAMMEEQGLKTGVVNARFVKPLDGEAIERMVAEAGVIVTVEDNILAGGFGASVLEYINDCNFSGTRLLRLGLPDQFIEHGTRQELLARYGLNGEGIAAAATAFVKAAGIVVTR